MNSTIVVGQVWDIQSTENFSTGGIRVYATLTEHPSNSQLALEWRIVAFSRHRELLKCQEGDLISVRGTVTQGHRSGQTVVADNIDILSDEPEPDVAKAKATDQE